MLPWVYPQITMPWWSLPLLCISTLYYIACMPSPTHSSPDQAHLGEKQSTASGHNRLSQSKRDSGKLPAAMPTSDALNTQPRATFVTSSTEVCPVNGKASSMHGAYSAASQASSQAIPSMFAAICCTDLSSPDYCSGVAGAIAVSTDLDQSAIQTDAASQPADSDSDDAASLVLPFTEPSVDEDFEIHSTSGLISEGVLGKQVSSNSSGSSSSSSDDSCSDGSCEEGGGDGGSGSDAGCSDEGLGDAHACTPTPASPANTSLVAQTLDTQKNSQHFCDLAQVSAWELHTSVPSEFFRCVWAWAHNLGFAVKSYFQ